MVGSRVGSLVGRLVGRYVGQVVGSDVVGLTLFMMGEKLGKVEGFILGVAVEGLTLGVSVVGETLGEVDGVADGVSVVGETLGEQLGEVEGFTLGDSDGDAEGGNRHENVTSTSPLTKPTLFSIRIPLTPRASHTTFPWSYKSSGSKINSIFDPHV
jgi:hypothetical protein